MFDPKESIRRIRQKLTAFRAAECGLAALEFALLLPLLISLLLGTFEVTRYTMIGRQVSSMVANAAQVVAARDGPVSRADLEFLEQSARAIPSIVRDGQASGLDFRAQSKLSVASVIFVPENPNCLQKGCPFKAQVVATFGDAARACGELSSAPDTNAYSRTALPESLFGPGSIIAVDAEYTYKPFFGSAILPASLLTVRRSAFLSPRYVDYAVLTPAGGNLIVCS